MDFTESENLWREFRSGQSEAVFLQIVKQYSAMVYSTALRLSDGDCGRAEDIMQEVFCSLVKKAGRLPMDLCLGGWLYRHTCHLSANQRRSERRRRKREMMAAEIMNDPVPQLPPEVIAHLDEALCSLPKTSREMLVMRYFERADYERIAKQFGLSDEAARKRISRSLEKLRVLFAKRGLGVSSVTLGAGLTALSTGQVSAAKQVEVVGRAMEVPVNTAGFVAHLSALLAGAIGVSAVAVGFQKISGSSEELPMISSSQPSERSFEAGRENPRATRESQADLIERIQRLSDGPQHALTSVELSALLARVADEDISDFAERAIAELSPEACKFCNRFLFGNWINRDPELALLAAMRGNFSSRSGLGSYLYRGGLHGWAYRNPQAVVDWLLENWTEIEGYDYQDSTGSMAASFVESAIEALVSKEGIEAAFEALESFPSEIQAEILRDLAGLKHSSLRGENAPAIYRYFKHHPKEQSHWTGFLRNWAEEDPKALMATLDKEPPEERYRSKLLLFGGIHPTGPEVEQADGTITMRSDGEVYATLAEREEQASLAGIEAGHLMEDIREAIAGSYRDLYSGRSFFESMTQLGETADLVDLKARVKNFETSRAQLSSHNDPEAVYHTAIWESALLTEQPFRVEICESLFENFYRIAPVKAREFAKLPHLPDDLAERFQSLAQIN